MYLEKLSNSNNRSREKKEPRGKKYRREKKTYNTAARYIRVCIMDDVQQLVGGSSSSSGRERQAMMTTTKRKRTAEFAQHMRRIEHVTDTTQLVEPIRAMLASVPYRLLCEHTAPLVARAFFECARDGFRSIVDAVARHLHVNPHEMTLEHTRGVVEILKAIADHAARQHVDSLLLRRQAAGDNGRDAVVRAFEETTRACKDTCAMCKKMNNVVAHTRWCFDDKDVTQALATGRTRYAIMNSTRGAVGLVACCITNEPFIGLFLSRLGLIRVDHEILLYETSMPCVMSMDEVRSAALRHFERRRRAGAL